MSLKGSAAAVAASGPPLQATKTAAAVATTETANGGATAGVPKWVYALAIGVPITAAMLYVLFGPDDGDNKVHTQQKCKISILKNAAWVLD